MCLAEVVPGRVAEQQESQLEDTLAEGLGAGVAAGVAAGVEVKVVHYRISTCGCSVRIQETAPQSCTGSTVGLHLTEQEVI